MAEPESKGQPTTETGSNTQFRPFDNVLNFRDVGKTVNDFLGQRRLVEGRLFRSARPDDASAEDRRRLVEEFNICTIIDLRTDTEHAQRTSKHQSASTVTTSSNHPPLPQEIPNVQYHAINLNGSTFSRSLLLRLPAFSIVRLLALMAIGQRIPAIKILGEGVMQPRGLIGLGYDSLDFSGKEISEVLSLCEEALRTPVATPEPSIIDEDDDSTAISPPGSRAPPPAVLIHCTQGKDRTGLVIALILLILDVPVPAIAYDYGLSEEELVSEREERLNEVREMGLGEEFVECPQGWVESVVGHLEEKWGGVEGYLRGIKWGEGGEELRRELLAS